MKTIQNFSGSGSTNLSKFGYTYNPVGTIATWTTQADSSTAIVNTLSYDAADQLTSAVQSGGGSASNAYGYDPAGNRLRATTATGTTTGNFNGVNQLTSLTSTGTLQTVSGYTSAAVTNVVVNAVPASISNSTNFSATVPLVPGSTNMISVVAQPSSSTGTTTTQRWSVVTSGTAPATQLAYDANGNVTTDENGNNYKWDALNRLTAIIYNSGTNSGNHTEFAYDGLSRRTQIVERTGTTVGSGTVTSTKNYLWIGSEIAEERNGSNTVTKRFFPQGEQQAGTDYYCNGDPVNGLDPDGRLGKGAIEDGAYVYDTVNNAGVSLVQGAENILGGLDTFGQSGFQSIDPYYSEMGQAATSLNADYSPLLKAGWYQNNSLSAAVQQTAAMTAPIFLGDPEASLTEGGSTTISSASDINSTVLANIQASQAARDASNYSQFANFNTAYDFYTDAGWNTTRTLQHISGIDLTQPVSVVELPEGTPAIQWQRPGAPVGNYFAPPGSTPDMLGIYGGGKVSNTFTAGTNTYVLQSTAAPVIDTWSVPGSSFPTSGTGLQWFTPNPQSFTPIPP